MSDRLTRRAGEAPFIATCLALALTALTACGGSDPVAPPMATRALPGDSVLAADACTESALASRTAAVRDGQCVRSAAALPVVSIEQRRQAQAVTTATLDAGTFFNWAESAYPSLFPGSKASQTSGPYVYRYYPETQLYLGVADGAVFGLGPLTGNALVQLGALQDFVCLALPGACVLPGAPTGLTASAGNASAQIAFTAPAGTASITGYTATCTAGISVRTVSGSASPLNVTQLVNGTVYFCTVNATGPAGSGPASNGVNVTPSASATGGTGGTGGSGGSGGTTTAVTTAGVQCNYAYSAFNSTASVNAISTSSWSCSGTVRTLAANGLPDHVTGTFPNSDNPSAIKSVTVSANYTLAPAIASSTGTAATVVGHALNGVKFDPNTNATCDSTGSNCSLNGQVGPWSIEAMGQTSFKLGLDSSNAHVQPTGEYHYHGMPEAMLTKMAKGQAMTLIGWAIDGFPVYARYGYTSASDATSAIKVMKGSYRTLATPGSGRPSTSQYPMGTFKQDWEYVAGLGDLDECNGRTGVTPEFPNGIYHYYVTDTYPYFQRCVKGTGASTGTGGSGGTGGPGGGGTPPPPPPPK